MTPLESLQIESAIADLKARRLRYSVLLDRTEHLQGTRYRESLESDYREICGQLAALTPDYTSGGKPATGAGGAGAV
jgi:hypothetical protein